MWSALDSWLHLNFIGKLILNIFTICPLGTLWSHFAEHSKCAQLFTHRVHWSHMTGHIQNVLRMYPLGILGSHNRVYLKCTQHLITGHIGVTCCLCFQCVHNVPSGYLGPCPQWVTEWHDRTWVSLWYKYNATMVSSDERMVCVRIVSKPNNKKSRMSD